MFSSCIRALKNRRHILKPVDGADSNSGTDDAKIRYFEHGTLKKRNHMQTSVIKHVMERTEPQCNFFEMEGVTIVYRKYVSLYLIAGVTSDENELAVLELLQNFLETLDQYFQKVSEVDIVFNLERVHIILDEMIVSGYVAETSKVRILAPLQLLDAAKK